MTARRGTDTHAAAVARPASHTVPLRIGDTVTATNTTGLSYKGTVVSASHRWAIVDFAGKLQETRVQVLAGPDGTRAAYVADYRPYWTFS